MGDFCRYNQPYSLFGALCTQTHRQAGSSSVNFVFLLLARQSKQVSFVLTRASVPAHVEMMGFLGIGQVMCK